MHRARHQRERGVLPVGASGLINSCRRASAAAHGHLARAAALTPDQSRHCLRATPTTPLTRELGAEASAIVGASADPVW